MHNPSLAPTLRRLAALSAASAAALLLSGCLIDLGDDGTDNQPVDEPVVQDEAPAADPALDAYVTALQATLPDLQAQFADTYSDVQIYGYAPGGVEYAYMYLTAVDPAEAVVYFDSYTQTLQELCDTSLFPEMTANGITAPSVTYTYYNPDGTLLWTHDFYPS